MKTRLIAALAVAAACIPLSQADARMGLAAGQCINKYHSPEDRIEYCQSYAKDGVSTDQYADAEYALGLAYRLAGQYPQAEAAQSQVMLLDSTWLNAWLERSTAYAEDGKYDLALGDVEFIATHVDDPAIADMQRCWVRAVAGKDLDLGYSDCNNAISTHPGDFAVLLARALISYKRGDMKNAIADLDNAVAARPKGAGAYYLRGIAKAAINDAGAADDIDKAKDLEPYIDEEFAGYNVKPAAPAASK
ncbi:MAG: tetratricopeptide repeat protein [Rhizomicrobium sp.]